MSQVITAAFKDGVFRPDAPPSLVPGAKVRLTIDAASSHDIQQSDAFADWEKLCDEDMDELDRLCEEAPIDSGGVRLTRDQLHDRR